MRPEQARRLTEGDELSHRRRGRCRFVAMDERDPSGETAWVSFPDDPDDHQMVSVGLLSAP